MRGLRAIWAALRGTRPTLPPPGPFTPTHQHKKGGLYRVLGQGILESDRSPVTIYDDAEGAIWVRATDEFEDGRFRDLSAPGQTDT